MSRVIPGTAFPTLDLPRVGGGRIDNALLAEAPQMAILNVYRGLHCPRCRRQFGDFIENAAALEEAGIRVYSISTDTKERAEEAVAEWGLGDLPVGYGLTV